MSNVEKFFENQIVSAPAVLRPAVAALNQGRLEAAFIDTSVMGWEVLAAGVPEGIEVVLLDGQQDGVLQMAEWAKSHTGYDAIHILSHGSAGSIRLGTGDLNNSAFNQYQNELSTIGNSLTADGDILVYGCHVANGEVGQEFIGKLAQATGADVAASDDVTGSTERNGNWVLEACEGIINSVVLNLDDYVGTLALSVDDSFVTGLDLPGELLLDSQSNLYVSSVGNYKLFKFLASSGTVTGGSASSAFLTHSSSWSLAGAAIDASGNLYVGTGNGTDSVVKYAASGGLPGNSGPTTIGSGFNLVADILVTPDGKLLISDNGANKVYLVSASGSFTPASALASVTVSYAEQMYLDGSNNLYVASADTGKIIKFASVGGAISLSVPSDFVTGLNSPRSITSDGAGNFYVGDGDENGNDDGNLYKFSSSGGVADASTLLHTFTGAGIGELLWGGNSTLYAALSSGAVAKITLPPDTTPPTFDVAPSVGSVTSSGFTPSASLDESGTVYYVVVPNNATAPTVAEVKAGTASGGGAALASGNSAANTGSFDTSFSSVTGLTASTDYDVYFVAKDAANNDQASVTKVDVTTSAAPDTTPPVAPTVGTANSTTAVSVTAETGSTVELFKWVDTNSDNTVDNGEVTSLGTATATGGTASFTGLTLANGDKLVAKATDAASNTSTYSSAQTVSISSPTPVPTPEPSPTPTPTPVPTPVPTPEPTPTPAGTFDGVTVNETVQSDGTKVVTIPVVTADRQDDPTTPQQTHADIPVVKNSDGESLLMVSVPTGVGMSVDGKASTLSKDDATAELIRRIEQKTPTGSSIQEEMKGNGFTFLNALPANEKLIVQTVVPTVTANTTTAPSQPLIVSGSSRANDGKQAVVIDVSQLPKGTVIQVENIDFIAIVGEVRAIGGSGQNVAVGDNQNQFIVLGADNDSIYGGGGQDTVGSLGGDDQTFGEAGDDTVYGGAGNDTLTGGIGNDRLNGGFGNDTAIQSGARSDYTISVDGHTVVLTHKTTEEIDRLLDVELVKFDSGDNLTIRYGEVFTAEYDPNVLNITANRYFVGHANAEEGYLPMGLALFIDGKQGHDVLHLLGKRSDYALERNGNHLEITRYSDGAMFDLNNAETLAFDSQDVVILARDRVEGILARMVQVYLNRDATAAEWKLGTKAVADYYAGFLQPQEVFDWFNARNTALAKMDNATYVQTLYQNAYGRQANTTELNGHLAELQNNSLDRNGLAVKIAASSEAITAIGTVMQFDGWV